MPGSSGVHRPLTTLSAGWGMSCALDAIISNCHTYWVFGGGVTRLNHFMVSPERIIMVQWGEVNYSLDFAQYGLRRPLLLTLMLILVRKQNITPSGSKTELLRGRGKVPVRTYNNERKCKN